MTLPPLHMPTGGAFASLFPPILDWQSQAEINSKRTAEAAGTLPPLYAVPELETPKPSFFLEDVDADSDGRGRLVGALLGREGYGGAGGGQVAAERDGEDTDDDGREPHASPERDVRIEELQVNPIWARAASAESGPSHRGFELRRWDSPGFPSPFRPTSSPTTFDALDTQSPAPIALPRLSSPRVLPATDAVSLLDHLVATTLTTPPPGLRWSRSKNRFAYDVRHGDRTAAGFVDEVLAIATAMRRLEIIASEESESLTPTHHAFLHALSSVIEYMKHRLTDNNGTVKQATPWLARSLALEDVTELGRAMCEVVCWPLSEPKAVGLPARPSSMLTHVYNHLARHRQNPVSSQLHITLCLAYLLQHAATPYLDVLHQWIGVADSSRADEDIRPQSQPWADLGITRSPLPPVDGQVRWEYSFSPRRMPAFIPSDMRRTFFDAGRSLRSLRDASDGLHPLCWTDWPIKATWGWGEEKEPEYDLRFHARRVQRQIDKWRAATVTRRPPPSRAMSVSSMSSMRRRHDMPSVPASPHLQATHSVPLSPAFIIDDMWLAAAHPPPPRPLVDFVSAPSKLPWNPTPEDLEAFIARHSDPAHPLVPRNIQSLDDYIATHVLAPPLAHATLISRALVSHYLDDLHFLDHLNVLHAFWLGGDAGFTERVGAALFGKDGGEAGDDVGLGRRARTRARLGIGSESGSRRASGFSGMASGLLTPAPSVLDTPSALLAASPGTSAPTEWGIGLGIGLSDRRRWPPGGAELAYALRTTLFDHDIALFASRGPVWRGIEDRVSFALRALPDDESDERRAQWLNPQAIEALDFLYLAYSPPAAIAPLLPVSIMDKYQVVHNLLLRLSRVDAVLRGLYFDILRPDSIAHSQRKVGVDAHHSRPASRINQPTIHAAILGVFDPKSPTARTLGHLRFLMSGFVTAFSRYVLDTVGHNSAVMHRRLASLHRGGASREVGTSRDPSRPMTPAWMILDDDELDLDFSDDNDLGAGFDDSQAQLAAISQLQSAHSLVLYHHIILNRVTRACLLSRGSAAAFGGLMALLALVLDFGKALKEIERGVMGADEGADVVAGMRVQWDETYAAFIKSLERLTRMRPEAEDESVDDTGDEHDLALLLGQGVSGRSTDLRELLLRLRLGQQSGIVARWDEQRKAEARGGEEKGGERHGAGSKAGEKSKVKEVTTAVEKSPDMVSVPDTARDSPATPTKSAVLDGDDDDDEDTPRPARFLSTRTHIPVSVPALAAAIDLLPVPVAQPGAELELELELAEDLEILPPPIVHETKPRRTAPETPKAQRIAQTQGLGVLSPPRLFQLNRAVPERSRSDDEISLD